LPDSGRSRPARGRTDHAHSREDEHGDHFIGRILSRREVLQRFGVAVAAAANGSGYAASTFNIGLV